MAFFDQLKRDLTNMGQEVTQQTKNIAEVSRLNGMISDEERKIEKEFLKIGKAYYTRHMDDSEAEEQGRISAIQSSYKKIFEYQERVKELKGITKCPQCGADVPNGALFCSLCGKSMKQEERCTCRKCGMLLAEGIVFCTNCGTEVGQNQPVEIPYKITEPPKRIYKEKNCCRQCGQELENGITFCTNCGTPISSGMDISGEVSTVSVNTDMNQDKRISSENRFSVNDTMEWESSMQEEAVTETQIIADIQQSVSDINMSQKCLCNKCGAELEDGDSFCLACGTQVREISDETQAIRGNYTNRKKYCPNCHAEIEDEDVFCAECGASIVL